MIQIVIPGLCAVCWQLEEESVTRLTTLMSPTPVASLAEFIKLRAQGKFCPAQTTDLFAFWSLEARRLTLWLEYN